jgi:hypothetical protein
MADDPPLRLVSDRTASWEWESYPRREPKPARERLSPLRKREKGDGLKPISR